MSRMYVLLFFPVILLLALCVAVPLSACSSYAVYTKEPVYGMNFDFPYDVELLFTIEKSPTGKKLFLGYFRMDMGDVPTLGMNEDGLFAALQSVDPVPYTGNDTRPTLTIGGAFQDALLKCRDLKEVEKMVSAYRLVHPQGFNIHTIIADKTGHAAIFEQGAKGNMVVKNDKNFLVMTNFLVSDFAGQSYKKVRGNGADRYKILYQGLEKNLNSLNFDKSFQLLDNVADYSTRVSTLYYPEKQEIYIVLKDFSRIWKVSLKTETLETFKGFTQQKKIKLDAKGITSTELNKWR